MGGNCLDSKVAVLMIQAVADLNLYPLAHYLPGSKMATSLSFSSHHLWLDLPDHKQPGPKMATKASHFPHLYLLRSWAHPPPTPWRRIPPGSPLLVGSEEMKGGKEMVLNGGVLVAQKQRTPFAFRSQIQSPASCGT